MEGLHNRKTKNIEDEAEVLDEQGKRSCLITKNAISNKIFIEQEQLLQKLRDQNDTANLTIQVKYTNL